jgi:hypothetical protein
MQLGQHFVVSCVKSNHSASGVGYKDSGVALRRNPSIRAGKHLSIMVRHIKVDQIRKGTMYSPGGQKSFSLIQSIIATGTNALDRTAYRLYRVLI